MDKDKIGKLTGIVEGVNAKRDKELQEAQNDRAGLKYVAVLAIFLVALVYILSLDN